MNVRLEVVVVPGGPRWGPAGLAARSALDKASRRDDAPPVSGDPAGRKHRHGGGLLRSPAGNARQPRLQRPTLLRLWRGEPRSLPPPPPPRPPARRAATPPRLPPRRPP